MSENLNLGIRLRPRALDEVIGQDHVVATLRAQLAKGDISRALMFVGPAGTGKTTMAKIYAREAQGWDFPQDAQPEVIEVNAASTRTMDDIRSLFEQINSFPMMGKYRVIILDEAQQLPAQTQNMLLLPFESPNSANIWIICTTDKGKIIPALQTRCAPIHELEPMSKKNIHDLVVRAAEVVGRTESCDEFEKEAITRRLTSARGLISAFEAFNNGTPAAEAVAAQSNAMSPKYNEIAMAIVYGSWLKESNVWGKACPSAASLIKALEEDLKKKSKKEQAAEEADTEETERVQVTDEDLNKKPAVAEALRAITAAFLKNEVMKGNAKAAAAIGLLATAMPARDFAIDWPATIGILFRINQHLRSDPTK